MKKETELQLRNRLDNVSQELAITKSNLASSEKQTAYLTVELEKHKMVLSAIKNSIAEHECEYVMTRPKFIKYFFEAESKIRAKDGEVAK